MQSCLMASRDVSDPIVLRDRVNTPLADKTIGRAPVCGCRVAVFSSNDVESLCAKPNHCDESQKHEGRMVWDDWTTSKLSEIHGEVLRRAFRLALHLPYNGEAYSPR